MSDLTLFGLDFFFSLPFGKMPKRFASRAFPNGGYRGYGGSSKFRRATAGKPTFTRRRGYSTVARTRGWAGARSEMKYFDTTKAAASISAPSASWAGTEIDPATFLTFCVPVKGTGINERIGRQINIHKIKIRALINVAFQANQTAADSATAIRYLLYVDQQTNAAQVQGETLMDAPGTSAPSNNMCTFQNLDSLGRFRVLKDKQLVMQNPSISWDGTNVEQSGLSRLVKISHTFRKPLNVHFNETNGGTIADIVDNSIHMLAVSSSTALGAEISYEARVSYKDL